MKDRDSFRGALLDIPFCDAFKKTKFYTEVYQKHRDEIIIGIRDGYINLYYNCDSIAKIDYKSPSRAYINPYYTDYKTSVLSDEEFVQLYDTIKTKSNQRYKNEKQSQERLFIDNNNNPSSEWYCIDVEYTRSLEGKKKAEDWRFDIIAITKTAPFRVALIELKYGIGAIGGKSGIRTHVKDYYAFHKENKFSTLKNEIVSIVTKLSEIGVTVPATLKNITINDIASQPEYYFITLNNNVEEGSTTTPEQTMSGYLFDDKRWNCNRVSNLVKSDGDYFDLTKNDKSFRPIFLFSTNTLPTIGINNLLDFSCYSIIHQYPFVK